MTLVDMTIADNIADSHGSGIYCYYSDVIIINSILWNNHAEQVYFESDDQEDDSLTICYSNIDGYQGAVLMESGVLNWLEGNTSLYPSFANINNYALNEDSPCIDAGTAYYEYEGEVLIELDEEEYYGSAPDMGAFEYGLVEIDEPTIQNSKPEIHNYPNPFNPETRIVFDLPQAEKVNLSVYNLKGQLVKILSVEVLPAGENWIIWDGGNKDNEKVSSGVYFIRLRSENEIINKKVMLIK